MSDPVSFRQKMDLAQLLLSERRDRIEQMMIASKKNGRFSETAIRLQQQRIPVLESIYADYKRAVLRQTTGEQK